MNSDSTVEKRQKARQENYDTQPLIDRILELCEQRNESYREASLASNLDHQAINRIRGGQRPLIQNCIQLADHFEINPNELLILAKWPPLKAFDIHAESVENLPPEAVEVAKDIARIANPGMRREVARAIQTLLSKYLDED
ncbi:MAG: helix-turn-helix transcriptional regulator [Anaerolineae bacterium]|nr:helix-turn-helix transcriptional regulator [Anaerolineae bacterium]